MAPRYYEKWSREVKESANFFQMRRRENYSEEERTRHVQNVMRSGCPHAAAMLFEGAYLTDVEVEQLFNNIRNGNDPEAVANALRFHGRYVCITETQAHELVAVLEKHKAATYALYALHGTRFEAVRKRLRSFESRRACF